MFFSPVDNWLIEKRKVDGAEGLWRVHDKLYDFTLWSRIHPGGKFWIDISRGTDITEAFESHHFSKKAENELQNYYRMNAETPRKPFTIFRENDFYKIFKMNVSQRGLTTLSEPSWILRCINDSLAATVFITSILAVKWGLAWVVVCGVLLGVLSSFSHIFFHMKENWRIFYFNLSLMSSRDWRIRHVLSHHQYRNTFSDLEISVWRPVFRSQEGPIELAINFLLFPFAAHLQFIQRFSDVFFGIKMGFLKEDVIPFILPVFMLILSGVRLWEVFITWNLIILVGSFIFCCMNSNFLKHDDITEMGNLERNENDFGIVQLSHSGDHPGVNGSALSFLNAFRGNVLHYLCPIISCGNLGKVISAFENTLDEFGISYGEKSKGFLDGLHEEKLPRGHLFVS